MNRPIRLGAALQGFLLAPLVPAVVLNGVTLIVNRVLSTTGTFSVAEILLMGAVAYGITAFVEVVFALPVFLILCHFDRVRYVPTLMIGFLIGYGIFVGLASPNLRRWSPEILLWAVGYGGVGCLSAAVFWWAWRRGEVADPLRPVG